jgi:ribosomal protein S8
MNQRLIVKNYLIEIKRGEHWMQDKVYIYDSCLNLPEKLEATILEYLYDEGFIQDRRTEYTVVRVED